MHVGLDLPGGAWLTAVLVAAIVFVGARDLPRSFREPKVRRRAVLIALRVLTVLAALALALQPRWTEEAVERGPGRLAVLLDASRSMSVATARERRSEAVRALASRWAAQPGGATASSFAFGDELRPRPLSESPEDEQGFADESTRLDEALDSLLAARGAEDLGAVVVVSDGAFDVDRAVAAARGLRVHAVAIPDRGELRDDTISEVEADAVAFLRQEGVARVRIRSIGLSSTSIPIALRDGDRVVHETTVELDEAGEGRAELRFTPTRVGRAVYRITIPVAPDDGVPENNERAFLVRVARDKLRVLLVAGAPSWDVRFLRAFLKRDPAIDLVSFFILRTANDLTMASPSELALIPFPTDELFREHLGSFDVVFFQDFDYGPYQMASYLGRIRDYVRRGGAFAMIGGERSFASGAYAGTPIGEILPVDLPTARGEGAGLAEGRFVPEVVPALARHPIVALASVPADTVSTWRGLAPLEGVNLFAGLRAGARVLLEHPTLRIDRTTRLPVLVVGEAGQGRVMAFATDTSWRWGMSTAGIRGDASAYERFWDRALRWLARDPSLEPTRVRTDRSRYGPGAKIEVEGLLRDARYVPIADAEVDLVLERLDGRSIATDHARSDREGRVAATMDGPRARGAYRVVVRAGDEPMAEGEERFVVEAGGEELADPRTRPESLRTLAERTGGRYIARPNDAPDLGALDTTRRRVVGIRTFAPLQHPIALAIVAGLFVAEWLLRRRWGRR